MQAAGSIGLKKVDRSVTCLENTEQIVSGTKPAPAPCMDKTAEDLKVRTKRFAVKILEFVVDLAIPRTPGSEALSRQLVRAGLGVAGNYRSSCRARSHTEFTARLGVVLEEADEAELWLDVTREKNWGDAARRQWLVDESRQLRAIFSKACVTARSRERRK